MDISGGVRIAAGAGCRGKQGAGIQHPSLHLHP